MHLTAVHFPYQTEIVTQKQFDDHITLYKGYVNKVNEITDKLASHAGRAEANATESEYRSLKKGESYAIDGVILHELYFQNIVAENAVMGKKMKYLTDHFFGGFEAWQADFTACAKAARGWCVLAYEQRTETCRNILLDSHDNGHICTAYPLLVLDMYEHAYFLDYGPDKAAYISRFLSQIPWHVIEKRAGTVLR